MDSDGLIIPDQLTTLKRRDEIRKGLNDEQWGMMRRMAKTDLFFLANTILQYGDLTDSLHGHLCRWLDLTRADQYRLTLLPRFHFKTTIVTISGSIQIALPDDTGMMPYPFNMGTDVRIGIAHEGAEHAANFLQSIANHVLGNSLLLALFPEILPGTKQRKNKTQLELPRERFWSEPTFEAFGVGTKSQGRHYNVIKPDDIYGVDARDSQTVHKTTIRWINSLPSLLTNLRTDKIDFSGTRYGYDDGYAHIYKVYNPIGLKSYVLSVWKRDDNGRFLKDEDGHFIPIFPERISWESMQPIMADKENYESNYLNDPAAGVSEFPESWVKYFDEERDKDGNEIYSYRDTDGKLVKCPLMALDRVMLVDPATTGLSGIVVTGTNYERQYKIFVLDELQERFTTEEFINKMISIALRWKVRTIVIEDVLFSVLYQNLLENEMVKRNIRIRVEGVKTRQTQKEDRVRGLTTYFSNERVLLSKNLPNLPRLITRFPGLKDYHSLDALAHGPSVWRRSAGMEQEEKRKDALDYLKSLRNPVTGYSL